MTLTKKNLYSNTYDVVEFCNDCFSGSPYAQNHLQQFLRENDKSFSNRKTQTNFDNFVKRTVQGISNIIFRKPLSFEEDLNEEQTKLTQSIDLRSSINEFAKDCTKSMIKDGFTFILVDTPKMIEAMSRYEEIKNNIRPYLVHLERLSVTNWKENSDGTFEFIQFTETIDTYNENLVENRDIITKIFFADGTVKIYEDNTLKDTINTGLNFVPAIKLGEDLIPIIYDQAKINVSHMNRSSELDSYLRIASAPIPVAYNMPQEDGGIVTVGVNEGINFQAPKTEAGFEWVSLEAKNTQAIRERIQDLETSMLNIAVTFATSSKVKTATQVDQESTEDESKLADIAQRVEEAINKALGYMSQYKEGLTFPLAVVNKDFDSNKLSAEQIDRLLAMYREGVISLETLWKHLEQGEVIDIQDKEAEKQIIADSGL